MARGTLVGALLVAALVFGLASSAQAGLVGLWRLDSSDANSVTANQVVGGAPGVLNNGAAIVGGDSRGSVLQTDGADDYVAAGGIKSLHQTNDDFTWTFWAKQAVGQPVNTDVILGNRFGGGGQWVKFTPNQFEYPAGSSINYPNIASDDVWHHHAVVKSGSTLSYYRDGAFVQSSTANGNLNALPFHMGGDPAAEQWQGRMDDVALYDHALSPSEVFNAMNGSFGPPRAVGQQMLNDTFSGVAVDTTLWNDIQKGLETQGAGTAPNITATVAGGQLTIGGTATQQYWTGRTLQSVPEFSTEYQTTFAVDRMSMSSTGSGARSGIWLWGDDQHFLLFAQNTEVAGGNWEYNWNDVGGLGGNPTGGGDNIGALDGLDGELGAHGMMLVFLPSAGNNATIEMYFDGQLVASQSFTNWTPSTFQVMITGQARAMGDTVSAVFDNAQVYVIPEPGTLALLGLGAAVAARRRRRKRA